jgi:hypothetical protein
MVQLVKLSFQIEVFARSQERYASSKRNVKHTEPVTPVALSLSFSAYQQQQAAKMTLFRPHAAALCCGIKSDLIPFILPAA